MDCINQNGYPSPVYKKGLKDRIDWSGRGLMKERYLHPEGVVQQSGRICRGWTIKENFHSFLKKYMRILSG
jgi:hypothetical protein